MDKKTTRRSSGPRTFDRDEAIQTAMRLFRLHGYEGVSISELTKAIGIAPPSLYAAFGNKAGLYREALDHYSTLSGALDGIEGAETLEQAVEGLLDAAARAVTTEERGCMISTGLVECAEEHKALHHNLAERRRGLRDNMAEALGRWLAPKEAAQLASLLFAIQQGMSIQARDGATLEDLRIIAKEATAGISARSLA
ncbi:transcriptional regulator [Pannonibacter phragmitetus]|uniref:TetR/AcrR family transcriptional regulator n=1 Tax=Pannonibacter phragmitetus TaxID=121719 RepID=UPI00067BD1B0|nr:TetR/AcrR family transcriptional regulator [Pannonibacter phragmitetus]KND16170.1 transcriptional regulator [Pannonibacter phragmitetus]